MKTEFSYDEAFGRNLGWVTREEALILKNSVVAVPGLGGAGGNHLVTLVRLGIENFHIADFDTFEIANFNRQEGANVDTLNRPKLSVMIERARAINPNVNIVGFGEGITKENIHRFLAGVNLMVDGMDAFEVEIRRDLFRICGEKKIPAITVGPIGMGGALMNFLPGKMSFEDYFGFAKRPDEEKFLRLILGLTPSFAQMESLVDRSFFDFKNRRAPSTPMGCMLAAAIAGTEALKILLRRGPVSCAPTGIHFDAYTNRVYQTHLPWGHRNPLFKIKLAIMRRKFKT